MRIYSIFESIDGEVNSFHQGRMTTFIRLAGCNLRCSYCDTRYAQRLEDGKEMSIPQIIDEVKKGVSNKVTITGGEPLMQSVALYGLTKALYWENYIISIETNGSFPIRSGYGVGSWIVDYKLPSSGQMMFMKDEFFMGLCANDFIKFVISDERDFFIALSKRDEFDKTCNAHFAFSPAFPMTASRLFSLLKENLIRDAIVNIQLHKYVLKDEPQ